MTVQSALLVLHVLAFGLGLGLSFSNWWNNRLAQLNSDEFQKGLGLQRRAIGRIGDGVISLIWISGLCLVLLRGYSDLGAMFAVKMLCVLGLTVCHARARTLGEKMFREKHRNHLKEQGDFMLGGWLLGAGAVATAIFAFA